MTVPSSIRHDLRALPPAAWMLLAGTFINRFGSFVLPFLVLYLTSRGYSATQAGVALTAYGVGSVLAVLVGGHLADTIGRRDCIVLSMFSAAATLLALAWTGDLRAIVALTGLAGFTSELYRPAALALVADLTPAGRRLTGYALYRLAINAGVAAGLAAGGFVAEHSFRWLFVGDAASSVLFGIAALVTFPADRRPLPAGRPPALAGLRAAAADPRITRVLLAGAAISFVFNQAYATLPLHVRAHGMSSRVYGLAMSLNGVLIMALELTLTAATRRLLPLRAMALGLMLTGVGFALTGAAATALALLVTVVIWTTGEMVLSPVAAAYVADVSPDDARGRYQAALSVAFMTGLVTAPLVGTALYDLRPWTLWTVCLAIGCGAAGLLLMPRRA